MRLRDELEDAQSEPKEQNCLENRKKWIPWLYVEINTIESRYGIPISVVAMVIQNVFLDGVMMTSVVSALYPI